MRYELHEKEKNTGESERAEKNLLLFVRMIQTRSFGSMSVHLIQYVPVLSVFICSTKYFTIYHFANLWSYPT